ncbi:uncharacterized protein L969DRAFT_17372 [Mixia osmundae IAM 14324]|nr:uncharacterized protein L969DRAFT_17372 [Mixia osmundae IAM 14324]KEI39450.1 hypothetical protein L969DRAFT_17372 [Mixia osmundae IAM 14324]
MSSVLLELAEHSTLRHDDAVLAQGHLKLSILTLPTTAVQSAASTSTSTAPPAYDDDEVLAVTVDELEVALPASTRISKTSDNTYAWSSGEKGSLRLTLGKDVEAADVELFESIIYSRCAYASDKSAEYRGQLVLVEQGSGQVVGTLDKDSTKMTEDDALSIDDDDTAKEPVIVDFGSNGTITVSPLSQVTAGYGQSGSRLIGAGEYISRGVVSAAEKLSTKMQTASANYVQSRPATETPLVFHPTAKTGVERVYTASTHAKTISGKTFSVVSGVAASIGGAAGKTLGIQSDPTGKPPAGFRGVINKTAVAFNTVLDGVEASGKHLLTTGTSSSAAVLGHKYGSDAEAAAQQLGGATKNVALVYVDVRGVSRRALIKAAGKSAVRARMADGQQVTLSNDATLASVETNDTKEKPKVKAA